MGIKCKHENNKFLINTIGNHENSMQKHKNLENRMLKTYEIRNGFYAIYALSAKWHQKSAKTRSPT